MSMYCSSDNVRCTLLMLSNDSKTWPRFPFSVTSNQNDPTAEWLRFSLGGRAGSDQQGLKLSALIAKVSATLTTSPSTVLGDLFSFEDQDVSIQCKLTPQKLTGKSFSAAINQLADYVKQWGAKEMVFEVGSGPVDSTTEAVFQINLGRGLYTAGTGISTLLPFSSFSGMKISGTGIHSGSPAPTSLPTLHSSMVFSNSLSTPRSTPASSGAPLGRAGTGRPTFLLSSSMIRCSGGLCPEATSFPLPPLLPSHISKQSILASTLLGTVGTGGTLHSFATGCSASSCTSALGTSSPSLLASIKPIPPQSQLTSSRLSPWQWPIMSASSGLHPLSTAGPSHVLFPTAQGTRSGSSSTGTKSTGNPPFPSSQNTNSGSNLPDTLGTVNAPASTSKSARSEWPIGVPAGSASAQSLWSQTRKSDGGWWGSVGTGNIVTHATKTGNTMSVIAGTGHTPLSTRSSRPGDLPLGTAGTGLTPLSTGSRRLGDNPWHTAGTGLTPLSTSRHTGSESILPGTTSSGRAPFPLQSSSWWCSASICPETWTTLKGSALTSTAAIRSLSGSVGISGNLLGNQYSVTVTMTKSGVSSGVSLMTTHATLNSILTGTAPKVTLPPTSSTIGIPPKSSTTKNGNGDDGM